MSPLVHTDTNGDTFEGIAVYSETFWIPSQEPAILKKTQTPLSGRRTGLTNKAYYRGFNSILPLPAAPCNSAMLDSKAYR